MALSNIELFNELTGRVFGELYLSFPIPMYLMAEDFVEAVTPEDQFQTDVTTDEAEFFIATARWLVNAGYLIGNVVPNNRVENAILTAKGLEVLNAAPKGLTYAPSFGEQLAKATKEGGNKSMKGLVTEVLSLGARLVSPFVGIS